MSHFSRAVLCAVSVVACSRPADHPEPPEGSVPIAAPAPADAGASASPAPTLERLFVSGERAPCQAEGARECLRVRGSEAEEWRLLYAQIEGLELDPEYTYEVRVEVYPVSDPPADAPASRYRLVEVLSRQKQPGAPEGR